MAAPKMPCDSVTEYRALLNAVTEELKSDSRLGEAAGLVPDECSFDEGEHHFQFSLSEMETELTDAASKSSEDRAAAVRALQGEIDRRLRGLETYERGADPRITNNLQHIFARKEFHRVGRQDPTALLQEQILRILMKLFSLIGSNPEEAQLLAEIFIWTLCGTVVLIMLWLLVRWAMREQPAQVSREILRFSPSSKSWRQWLSEARAARSRGDLREAVHLGYWAAISYLESSGAWRSDSARTPREYLRLIAPDHPARRALADITGKFEVAWYGQRIPEASDCAAMLAEVEQIGCR